MAGYYSNIILIKLYSMRETLQGFSQVSKCSSFLACLYLFSIYLTQYALRGKERTNRVNRSIKEYISFKMWVAKILLAWRQSAW